MLQPALTMREKPAESKLNSHGTEPAAIVMHRCGLEEVLPEIDLALIMTVNPGFGGQSYIPASTKKITRLRSKLDKIGSEAEIQVDGGINAKTIAEAAGAGATVLVAGSAIFNDRTSVAENIQHLRSLL